MAIPTYVDFIPLYDFSQWEIAIQNFFCDTTQGGGNFSMPKDNSDASRESWQPAVNTTAFFTGFQAQLFQKQRPRIDLGPVDYREVKQTRIVDATGRLRRNAWIVPLTFYVITPADYQTHVQLLALTRSIVHMMNPIGINPANGSADLIPKSGLNAFLTSHELAIIQDAGGPTFGGYLSTDKGYFLTPLKYDAKFDVKASAWPSGTLNA